MQPVRTAAVILAAGAGERFGSPTPKQFLEVAGAPVIAWSVRAFREAGIEPVAAVPPGWEGFCRERLGLETIVGGKSRTDTVRRVLVWLARKGYTYSFLHAATRPFLLPELVRFLLEHIGDFAALVTAQEITGGLVDRVAGRSLDRSRHRLITSPELVAVGPLSEALARHPGDHTLAAEALLLVGERVGYVETGGLFFKITYPEDLSVAERLLGNGAPLVRLAGPFPFTSA